jgi:hypothetical protein
MCNGIKKNQMHAYEMSYKWQLYHTYTVATICAHSCYIHNDFGSPITSVVPLGTRANTNKGNTRMSLRRFISANDLNIENSNHF